MVVSNPQRNRARSLSTPYRVLRPLARGGMGEVVLAMRREGTFTRTFAMKRLHPHLREDHDVRTMFLDEARIAGLLSHPHLISVVDVGENEDGPFLVMEYVEGVSVAQVIQKAITDEREIPLQLAVHVIRQAAAGLQAAHETKSLDGEPLHLVHRDVSPHNLLVGYDGITRVTDFGIARAIGRTQQTSTGVLKGKLGYMSPEQLSFRGQDQRSDLFSLGVTFFELLAARRLYPSNDGEKTARRILNEPPPDILDDRDDVPPELAELLFRLLAKDPALRPESAGAIAATLQELETTLAEELGAFEPATYLQEMFASERAEAAALLSQSLEQANSATVAATATATDSPSAPTTESAHHSRRRGLGIAVLGVALGLALAAFWARRVSSPAPELPAKDSTAAIAEPAPVSNAEETPAARTTKTPESNSDAALQPAAADSEPVVAPKTEPDKPSKSATAPPSSPSSRSSNTQKPKTGVSTWDW